MIDLIHLSTSVLLGLFAGSLLTEGAVLVPYWRRMDPAEFFRLHHTMGPNLFRYFAPLTVIAVMSGMLGALVALGTSWLWNITAGICVATLAIFFIYFKDANQSFADKSLAEADLADELRRWASWHWFRTALIILAFAISVLANANS